MPLNDSGDGKKGYQWPADQLTSAEMAILHRLRQVTGMPINRLLREAVRKLEQSLGIAPVTEDSETNAPKA